MRMWLVDPRLMCRKHLLGEHVELHMLAGCLRLGKRIAGYVNAGLVDTSKMLERHAALVDEMERRGWRHRSPLAVAEDVVAVGRVDVVANEAELAARCAGCMRDHGAVESVPLVEE